jgi:extradiol dioxygenase family protein
MDLEDAWSRQGRPMWVSPRIMREYYAHFLLAAHVQDPQHEIYKSVVGGTIRAKYRGRILTTEEAAALAEIRWDANSPYALPPDIQLSVEDALMVFDLAQYRFGDDPATP